MLKVIPIPQKKHIGRIVSILVSFSLLILFTVLLHLNKNEENEYKKYNKYDRIDLAIQHEFDMTQDPELGFVPRERLKRAKDNIDAMLAFHGRSGIPGLTWEERGPSNVAGRTRSILIDAADVSNNTVFAGSVGGGLWKTTNFSSGTPTWISVDDFFANLATSLPALIW